MLKNIKNHFSISLIMPVHNGATTLEKVLASLLNQNFQFDELIIIDDASTDKSVEAIKNFLGGKIEYKLFYHNIQQGLAETYNQAINESDGELIVIMHQDVILQKGALEEIISPFSDSAVVATAHLVDHPLGIWNQYNFWQKCFFARLAGKKFSGLDGKFDGFRLAALKKIGMFDEENFFTAGEDGDILARLKKVGKIFQTRAKIVHLHKIDPNFSWQDIIYKQKQYSEAQGALLRKGSMINPLLILKSFFREILLLGLLIPDANLFFLAMIIFYCFWYTGKVFLTEYKNWRVLILPFFNILLLCVSFSSSLKGIVYGKQRI